MNQQQLRSKLLRLFNESELKDLCFELSLDFETLSGNNKNDIVRELILYCGRLGKLEELINQCQKLRPNESWELTEWDTEEVPNNVLPTVETEFEHELKYVPKLSTQIKLLASLQNDDIYHLIGTISSALGLSNSYILEPTDAEGIHDIYHDTEALDLFNEGNSLRVRHSGKDIKITIKKNRGITGSEFKRDEISIACDQETLQRHINENFIELTRDELPHLIGKKLKPVIAIKNSRRLFTMRPKDEINIPDGFKAKLSFDIFTMVNVRVGRSANEMYELEIEALNNKASQNLQDIAKNINRIIPDLTPSKISKYGRAINYFKLTSSPIIQWAFNWITGPGLNWVSLSFLILGFALTIINLVVLLVNN